MYILNLHDDSAEELERHLAHAGSLPTALRQWAELLRAYTEALNKIAEGLEIAVNGDDCEVVFNATQDSHRIEFRGKTEGANRVLAALNTIDLVWEVDDATGKDIGSGRKEGGAMTVVRALRHGEVFVSRRSAQ